MHRGQWGASHGNQRQYVATGRWFLFVGHDDDYDSGGPLMARKGNMWQLESGWYMFIMVMIVIGGEASRG